MGVGLLCAGPASGQVYGSARPGGQANVALCLYLSASEPVAEWPAAARRQQAWQVLAHHLEQSGWRPLPLDQVLLGQQKHRARHADYLPVELLDDLRERNGVSYLLVGTLFLQERRIDLAWRLVDTASARVMAVGIDGLGLEPVMDLGPEAEDRWLQGMGALARNWRPDPVPTAAGGAEPLALVPVTTLGFHPLVRALAGQALAMGVVEQPGITVLDPGVLAAFLKDRDIRPEMICAPAGRLIRERFGARRLLLAEMIPDHQPTSRGMAARSAALPGGQGQGRGLDFTFSLRLVDLDSYSVLAGGLENHDGEIQSGWFGVVKDRSLPDILIEMAGKLLAEINQTAKETHR